MLVQNLLIYLITSKSARLNGKNVLEIFNSFVQLFRPTIFAMTKISQNWNRNTSECLCTMLVILFDFNKKWKISTCFGENFHYKMSRKSVPQFSAVTLVAKLA
jgi:hypothetical protein